VDAEETIEAFAKANKKQSLAHQEPFVFNVYSGSAANMPVYEPKPQPPFEFGEEYLQAVGGESASLDSSQESAQSRSLGAEPLKKSRSRRKKIKSKIRVRRECLIRCVIILVNLTCRSFFFFFFFEGCGYGNSFWRSC